MEWFPVTFGKSNLQRSYVWVIDIDKPKIYNTYCISKWWRYLFCTAFLCIRVTEWRRLYNTNLNVNASICFIFMIVPGDFISSIHQYSLGLRTRKMVVCRGMGKWLRTWPTKYNETENRVHINWGVLNIGFEFMPFKIQRVLMQAINHNGLSTFSEPNLFCC